MFKNKIKLKYFIIGDLLASGTISGPNPNSLGCLLEASKGGKEQI